MTIKELKSFPLFKANSKAIYEQALNMAIQKSNGKAKLSKLDPKIIEFRVHYVTNVKLINSLMECIVRSGCIDGRVDKAARELGCSN